MRFVLTIVAAILLAGCTENLDLPNVGGATDTVSEAAAAPAGEEAVRLLAATTSEAVFDPDRVGVRGTFREPERSGTIVLLQDRTAQAYYFLANVTMPDGATVTIGHAARGTQTNVIRADATYLGRDEVPHAVSPLDLVGDASKEEEGAADDLFSSGFSRAEVRSVEATTWNDEPAWRIDAADRSATVSAIFYADDLRLAWFNLTRGEGDGRRESVLEVLYDDAVVVPFETTGDRASFRMSTDEKRDFGEQGMTVLGTLKHDHREEVRLEDVEMRVRVRGPPVNETSPPEDRVEATMRLDEGEKEEGGHKLRYVDVDGDGFVSAGDTFEFVPGSQDAQLGWFDLWADDWEGRQNVPAAGVLALLAGLGAATLAFRRR